MARYTVIISFDAPDETTAEEIRSDIHDLVTDAHEGYVGDPDRELAQHALQVTIGPLAHG